MLSEAILYKKNWQKEQRARLKDGCDNDSYVYLHLNADDDLPHHVGVGYTTTRPWDMNRTKIHKNKVAKHGVRVEIIADELTWESALWWEVRWIKALKATGYELTNLTDGGEGSRGYKHTSSAIEKMTGILQNKIASGDYISPMCLPHVKEAHLAATQSEEFKQKQRDRISIEGNILDRPGARESHLQAVNTVEWREKQRARLLANNPMFTDDARARHREVISSPEYKIKKVETAPKGDSHYSKKDPSLGKRNGKRLQESFTPEARVEYALKGWETRRNNIIAKGEDYVPEKSKKQISAQIDHGKRLQESLTPELRVKNAKKGWETRRRNQLLKEEK